MEKNSNVCGCKNGFRIFKSSMWPIFAILSKNTLKINRIQDNFVDFQFIFDSQESNDIKPKIELLFNGE